MEAQRRGGCIPEDGPRHFRISDVVEKGLKIVVASICQDVLHVLHILILEIVDA